MARKKSEAYRTRAWQRIEDTVLREVARELAQLLESLAREVDGKADKQFEP